MAIIIIKDEATPFFNKVVSELPKAIRKDKKKLAQVVRKGFKQSIVEHHLVWSRTLFNQTRVIPHGNKDYAISVPQQGIYMDRMRPHWVSPYNYPEVMHWQLTKGRRMFPVPKAMLVKRHPWIRAGFNLAANQFDTALQMGTINQLFS